MEDCLNSPQEMMLLQTDVSFNESSGEASSLITTDDELQERVTEDEGHNDQEHHDEFDTVHEEQFGNNDESDLHGEQAVVEHVPVNEPEGNIGEQEVEDKVYHKVCKDLFLAATEHAVSNCAVDAIMKAFNPIANQRLPCFKTIKNKFKEELPDIQIIAHYQRQSDGTVHQVGPVKVIPEKGLPRTEFRLLCETTYVKNFNDIVQIHAQQHDGRLPSKNITLSCDGVAESKSSRVSLNVYAIQFHNCRRPYAVLIERPLLGKATYQFIGKEAATEKACEIITSAGYRLQWLIADAPKRAELRNFSPYNSYFGCDLCTIK